MTQSSVQGGGGAVALTADLIARAVIAAARSYGDDPLAAMMARRSGRRCLAPAATGICQATGADMARVARIIGFNPHNIGRARSVAGFDLASVAAERAARFCGWRPETRASVVGGAGPEIVRAPIGPVNGVRTLTAKAAQREVLQALRAGPATGTELIARVRLAEGQVRDAVAELRASGQVVRDTPPECEQYTYRVAG